MGQTDIPWTFRGALTDGVLGATRPVVAEMRGPCSELDPGEWKPGEKATLKLKIEANFYRLTHGGDVLHEVTSRTWCASSTAPTSSRSSAPRSESRPPRQQEIQPMAEKGNGPVTIVLRHPVTVEGETHDRLTMRRAKARDSRDAQKQAAGQTIADVDIRLFANLCEVSTDVIEELDMSDYTAVQTAYTGFLGG